MFYAHSIENQPIENWHKLKEHLEEVSKTAASFASKFGAYDYGLVAGLLHDIGKYSADFQDRLKGKRKLVDHSTAGAREAYARYGYMGLILAYVVAGHHSGLPDWIMEGSDSSLAYRLEDKEISDYQAFAGEINLPSALPKLPLKGNKNTLPFAFFQFIRFLYSCLVDADYLDTEKALSPEISARRNGNGDADFSVLYSRLESYINDIWEKSNKSSPINIKRMEILEKCIKAASLPKSLFSLTVPTGGGKTLSSLAFACKHAIIHKLKRIIYVIPYTSIIEQNADVFRKAVGTENVLEHHSNFQFEKYESEEGFEPDKMRLAAENWDIPIVVTTNVQFFESLFSDKSSVCRKLHNICESVIILDEAQMLPVNYLKPCLAALCELIRNYGASVVLCTATQPYLNKLLPEDMQPIEIMAVSADRSRVRTEGGNAGPEEDSSGRQSGVSPAEPAMESAVSAAVFPSEQASDDPTTTVKGYALQVGEANGNPSASDLYDAFKRVDISFAGRLTNEALCSKLKDQEQVLCIVNTRTHASQLYDLMNDLLDDTDGLFHLSTMMCAKHRSKVLEQIRERLWYNKKIRRSPRLNENGQFKACRVISTQLVEAGVDLDFPVVYRAVAGIDSIVQAAGRCNREGDLPTGNVYVFEPESTVKADSFLERAASIGMSVIRNYKNIVSAEAVKSYFKQLYETDEQFLDKENILRKINNGAGNLHFPFGTVASSFKIIQNNQYPIVIPYDDKCLKLLKQAEWMDSPMKLARQLQPYIVQVYPYQRKALIDNRLLSPVGNTFEVLWNMDYYSMEKGLIIPEGNEPNKALIIDW